MKTQLLLLALLFPALSQAQGYENSKHALAVNYEIFLFNGAPFLGTLGIQGLKYDFVLGNPDRIGLTYLSTGMQLMRFDEESFLAIPMELCIGTSLRIFSFHLGAGGVIHTGGEYLKPAMFYTMHGKFRFKFGQSPIFLDLETRFLGSYAFEYQYGSWHLPAKRSGNAFSPGIGLSVGSYLE